MSCAVILQQRVYGFSCLYYTFACLDDLQGLMYEHWVCIYAS